MNPGSEEARSAGCRCPVIDNGYGAGWRGNPHLFVMTADCPIHGDKAKRGKR